MKNLVFVTIVFVFMTSLISCETSEVNEETGIETTEQQAGDKDQYQSPYERDE